MSRKIYALVLAILLISFWSYGAGKNTMNNPIYLVIVSDDYANSPSLQLFQDFRELDFDVQIVVGTSIGSTKDDYRDYIRNLMPDFVLLVSKYGDFPVHIIPYPALVESYNYYVASSLEGHPTPDIPLGLFLVENEAELSNIVDKTISYENNFNDYPKEYYGHAGSIEALPPWPLEFNEEILTEMYTHYFAPESYNFTLATANDDTPNDVWTDIEMINNGIRFMVYHGHGNINKWSFGLGTGGLFQLTNTIYPIIFSFACLTGTFSGGVDKNSIDCLAQKITTSEHGAVAFFGAYNISGKGMNQILEGAINGVFNDAIEPRLGNVLIHAYANTMNSNTVDLYYPTVTDAERIRAAWQFHLFGDPALKIRDSAINNASDFADHNSFISISPNPTIGIIKIISDKEIFQWSIYSLNGEILLTDKYTSEIDLSYYPQGVYILSLNLGNETFTGKY